MKVVKSEIYWQEEFCGGLTTNSKIKRDRGVLYVVVTKIYLKIDCKIFCFKKIIYIFEMLG